jgi:ketosteroid isomerase-like protein
MNDRMDVRKNGPTATARALFEAFFERRREDAELLISDDFAFTSPYDDAIDRTTYFARCWPNGDRFVDFQIERTAEDADGVFVTYACKLKDGNLFRNTEYLKVRHGQVVCVEVYFGAMYRDGKFVSQQESAVT